MANKRVVRKSDGNYYPQTRKWFIWRDMKVMVYPKALDIFVGGYLIDLWFKTEAEAIDHLLNHSRKVFELE